VSGRTLAIGLDGMPKSLLDQLTAQGIMPNVAALTADDRCAELRAPVPEISSTSWATFLTGVNPARHGIFGFVDLRPGSYQTYFPNVEDLRAPPLWAYAEWQGRTTLCLNVPGTYPSLRSRRRRSTHPGWPNRCAGWATNSTSRWATWPRTRAPS
jgi:predicted AlkP superfamily phosphohydrolase/phosphomutase